MKIKRRVFEMRKFWKLVLMALGVVGLLAACGDSTDDVDGSTDDPDVEETDDGEEEEPEVTEEQIGSEDAEIELVFWEFGNTGYDVLIEEDVEVDTYIYIITLKQDIYDVK